MAPHHVPADAVGLSLVRTCLRAALAALPGLQVANHRKRKTERQVSDERPLIYRRELFGLSPTDDASEAALKSVKLGECVELKLKRPRNLQQHRLFWALMQKVYENQEHYTSPEQVCTAFKFACGLTESIKTARGIIQVPKSISFAKMDQIQFNEFFKLAVDFCVAEVIPGLKSEDLEREVLEMIA